MAKPAVTVSVITYNSSKYVLETLESIKAQTYPNLILQIGDDCSTDNTVEICRKWIDENKERFVKTKIIVPEHNTGISGNANRCWDACETEWIKDIAGDDLLMPNCIEDFMAFVKENPDAIIVFSKLECFGLDNDSIRIINGYFLQAYKMLEDYSVDEKLDRLLTQGNFLPAPSVFTNVLKIRELKIRHDERIPMIEDLPKWVNFLRTGNDFFFLNKPLVKYRIGSGVSTTKVKESFNYQKNVRAYTIFYQLLYGLERGNLSQLDVIYQYEIQLLKKCQELERTKALKMQNAILSLLLRFRKLLSTWF